MLNREHGFMYWSAVITTAPFEADGAESSPACPAPACVEIGSADDALPRHLSGLERRLSRRKLENGRAVRTFYDAARCNTRVHTHWVGGFQKVLEETLSEPDRDKRKMLLYGDFFTHSLWAITYSSTNIEAVLRVHARVPRRPRPQGDEIDEATSAFSRPPAVRAGPMGPATMTVSSSTPRSTSATRTRC